MTKSDFSIRDFTKILVVKIFAMSLVLGELAACSSRPPAAQSQMGSADQVSSAWQAKGPQIGQGNAGDSDYSEKVNLPSAPLNTPLCGVAQHESAQTGAGIYGRSLESGNSCVQSACFQPLTGTYIAQDNQITVCR